MKVSELIDELLYLKGVHGDVDVLLDGTDSCGCMGMWDPTPKYEDIYGITL